MKYQKKSKIVKYRDENYRYDVYMVNQNSEIQLGTRTDSETKKEENLYRILFDIDVYDESSRNKEINFEKMNQCIFDIYKANLKEQFLEELKKENETLKNIKNEKIDLICLTHPDLDHCKGLEKILDLADSHTKVLYPVGLHGKKYSNHDVCRAVNKINHFLSMNRNNSNKPQMISCIGNQIIVNNINFYYPFNEDEYLFKEKIVDNK